MQNVLLYLAAFLSLTFPILPSNCTEMLKYRIWKRLFFNAIAAVMHLKYTHSSLPLKADAPKHTEAPSRR